MLKALAMGASGLVSLAIGMMLQAPPPPPDGGPPPPLKKKGEPGPGGDLKKAYDLLRRLRADEGPAGRPAERLRDWTERATRLYRRGLRAGEDGDDRAAHEYGAAAHDLARAVDHARNAERLDRGESDLPPPPGGGGPREEGERASRDLRRAYDRIREAQSDGADVPDGRFYLDAARDLYNAARRDLEDDRVERAGELARAAEAMTHVPEHLGRLAGPGPDDRRPPGPEAKKKERDRRKDEGPPPPRRGREERDIPPPLP